MARPLKSNIWKYGLLLVTNKRVFIAILGAYYLTVPGVGLAEVGLLLLAGQLAGFVLEVPSGYISDKIGHRKALVISHAFLIFSTVGFIMANNLTILILASVLLSGGFAFHSGTGNAFMHETLKGLGREKDYAMVMGKLSSFGFAVPIIFSATAPFLVAISFKLTFVAMLVVDAVGLIAAISLVPPPVPPEHIKEIGLTNFHQVIQEGYRLGFFAFALFSGIVAGILFGVEGFRSVYQVFIGIPVIWLGVFFGIGRGLASIMLIYSGRISAALSTFSFYRIEVLAYSLFTLLLAFVATPWVVAAAFIAINAFHWGVHKVHHVHMMEIISDSRFKATLLSTEAQIGHIVSAGAAFGIGLTIEYFSYESGFLMAGLAFLAMLVPLYLVIAKRPRAMVRPAHS